MNKDETKCVDTEREDRKAGAVGNVITEEYVEAARSYMEALEARDDYEKILSMGKMGALENLADKLSMAGLVK